MATNIIEILSDSLDERIKSDVENVIFYHPETGEKLEIQLGKANREHFARHIEKLRKYIDAAEIVAEPVVSKPKAAKTDSEISKIREWAKAEGYPVGDRGRIKAEIKEAYYAAQQEAVTDKVMGPVQDSSDDAAPEVTSTLDEALESSAEGNVKDLGDFTQYAEPKEFICGDDVMALLDEVTGEVDSASATK